jgi:hypothetical protein
MTRQCAHDPDEENYASVLSFDGLGMARSRALTRRRRPQPPLVKPV